jgi:hypothetical protein
MLPPGPGKPRRNHGQTQRRPIALEEIHEPDKISSWHSDIIGTEKNVTGVLGVDLFQSGAETAIQPE